MKVGELPDESNFDNCSLNNVEKFKKGIDSFFMSLLMLKNEQTNQFNYVCREVLEYLELGEDEEESFCDMTSEAIANNQIKEDDKI